MIHSLLVGAGGFGSCLCFGLRVECGAMASAKSVGENLSRLQCGGEFFNYSLLLNYFFVPQYFYFFPLSPLSKETIACPVENLNK